MIPVENRSSENDELRNLLSGMTVNQLRYLVARLECNTDAEAARMIGMRASTISEWGEPVKRALRLMHQDGVITALEMQRRALPKAMATKVAGLESDNEKIRQDVATEIIERNLGKAPATVEVNVKTYASGL